MTIAANRIHADPVNTALIGSAMCSTTAFFALAIAAMLARLAGIDTLGIHTHVTGIVKPMTQEIVVFTVAIRASLTPRALTTVCALANQLTAIAVPILTVPAVGRGRCDGKRQAYYQKPRPAKSYGLRSHFSAPSIVSSLALTAFTRLSVGLLMFT